MTVMLTKTEVPVDIPEAKVTRQVPAHQTLRGLGAASSRFNALLDVDATNRGTLADQIVMAEAFTTYVQACLDAITMAEADLDGFVEGLIAEGGYVDRLKRATMSAEELRDKHLTNRDEYEGNDVAELPTDGIVTRIDNAYDAQIAAETDAETKLHEAARTTAVYAEVKPRYDAEIVRLDADWQSRFKAEVAAAGADQEEITRLYDDPEYYVPRQAVATELDREFHDYQQLSIDAKVASQAALGVLEHCRQTFFRLSARKVTLEREDLQFEADTVVQDANLEELAAELAGLISDYNQLVTVAEQAQMAFSTLSYKQFETAYLGMVVAGGQESELSQVLQRFGQAAAPAEAETAGAEPEVEQSAEVGEPEVAAAAPAEAELAKPAHSARHGASTPEEPGDLEWAVDPNI